MPTRIIRTDADKALLHRWLAAMKPPYTVDVVMGKHRSTDQNRLSRLWYGEISEQLGDQTTEEVRGECKLTLGVPILRAENEHFRERYDEAVKPLAYPQKLALMMEPLDMPVTRLMKTEQFTRYLDAIVRHYGTQGVVLTQPVAA